MRQSTGYRTALILGMAAIAAAQLPGLGGELLYDSVSRILLQDRLQDLWPPHYLYTNSRPFLYLTFALNLAIHGTSPFGFKLVGFLLHLSNVLLLYKVLRLLQRQKRLPEVLRYDNWFPVVCAILWGIHPIAPSAVFYVWQRGVLLSCTASLLLYCAFLRAQHSDHPSRWYLFCGLASLIGILSRETFVAVLGTLLVFDYCLSGLSLQQMLHLRWQLFLILLLTMLPMAFLLKVHGAGFHGQPGWWGDKLLVSPWVYAFHMPAVHLKYIQLAFLPLRLCFTYDWPLNGTWESELPAIAGFGALLLLCIYGLRKRSLWAFGPLFLILATAPTASILPLTEPIQDYRLYIPLAALVPWAYGVIRPYWRASRPVTVAGLLAVILIFATITLRRSTVYKSRILVWKDTIAQQPSFLRAHYNLACAYLDYGAYDNAIRILETVHCLAPNDADAWINHALCLMDLKRYQDVLAVLERYEKAGIPNRELHANVWAYRAWALRKLGKQTESDQAIRNALALDPHSPTVRKQAEGLRQMNQHP